VCYRLYDEADYLAQPEYTDPEIRRTNLAAVVLQMRAFGLGDIETFPFLDPPEPRAVRDALTLLTELGALVGDRLTPVGRTMARLPVDPRLGRMLVEASAQGALAELLIIASGLALQDPRSGRWRRAAPQMPRTSNSPTSDPTTWRT
jgi:ATP-dependent helicase HrpA